MTFDGEMSKIPIMLQVSDDEGQLGEVDDNNARNG